MATHSSVLAWRIPGMEEPGGLLSVGLHRLGHDWSDLAATWKGEDSGSRRLTKLLFFSQRRCYVSLSGMPEGGFPWKGPVACQDPLRPLAGGCYGHWHKATCQTGREPGWEGGWRWSAFISTGLCFLGTPANVKWNLIVVFSRSPPSIVEDIHQGKSEHYGSETLREFLKLLPESEEVRNLGHEFLMLRVIIKASSVLGMSELTWNGHSFTQSPSFLF